MVTNSVVQAHVREVNFFEFAHCWNFLETIIRMVVFTALRLCILHEILTCYLLILSLWIIDTMLIPIAPDLGSILNSHSRAAELDLRHSILIWFFLNECLIRLPF